MPEPYRRHWLVIEYNKTVKIPLTEDIQKLEAEMLDIKNKNDALEVNNQSMNQ